METIVDGMIYLITDTNEWSVCYACPEDYDYTKSPFYEILDPTNGKEMITFCSKCYAKYGKEYTMRKLHEKSRELELLRVDIHNRIDIYQSAISSIRTYLTSETK